MYETLKTSLTAWNNSTSDRTKLQHFYIVIAAMLLIVAGVIGLLNQDLGQQLLAIAIAAAVIFLINAVAWALLQSFVLFRLQTKPIAEDASVEIAAPARAPRKVSPRKK